MQRLYRVPLPIADPPAEVDLVRLRWRRRALLSIELQQVEALAGILQFDGPVKRKAPVQHPLANRMVPYLFDKNRL